MRLVLHLGPLSLELQTGASEACRKLLTGFSGVQPRPMKAADLPFCPACQECPPVANSEQDHYRDVKHLRTPNELDAYDIAVTDRRHVIPENELLALYSFKEKVPCSNPGRHPHQDGLLVRTACGIVIALGNQCGSQLVENFRRIEEVARRARDYNRFLPDTSARLVKLRERYNTALKTSRSLFGFRACLRDELPWFPSAVTQIRDEPVVGRELFDWQRDKIDKFFGDLGELEHERQKWETALPGLKAQREVSGRLRTLEERLDDFDAWARLAAVLLTRSGFDAAAARVDSEYETVAAEVYDRNAGAMVRRQREVLRRTRERCVTTDVGIADRVSGRTVFVEWAR